MIITVSEKGKMVIPARIRRQLGITPGTKLDVLPDESGFRVLLSTSEKKRTAAECIGIAGYSGNTVSVDQMDVAKYATKS